MHVYVGVTPAGPRASTGLCHISDFEGNLLKQEPKLFTVYHTAHKQAGRSENKLILSNLLEGSLNKYAKILLGYDNGSGAVVPISPSELCIHT